MTGEPPLPEGLSKERNVRLSGRRHQPWLRRLGVLVAVALCAIGLAGVLGQGFSTTTVTDPATTLSVEAPDRARAGLIAQATVRIRAKERIDDPRLVLDRGWIDGITINTVAPQPAENTALGERLVWFYSPLEAGDGLVVRVEFQVNPTATGRTMPHGADLQDGTRTIARIDRTLTILP